MTDDRIEHALTAEQERLALAANDMRQAAAAARLLERRHDFHARRALETAISVCYARPWTRNQIGKLEDAWLPEVGPYRDLHDRLLKLRNKTYAHTDRDGGRKAVAQSGPGNVVGFGEMWERLPASEVTAIVELCERQVERFTQGLVDQIDAARNPV
jgi:hypothetical protein